MLKSSAAMAAATMTSRILGMVREMVFAAFMGTTWVAGAFTLAFQVPNLFRRLLGEGALTAAFIPIFKQKHVSEGEKATWAAANAVLSGLMAAAGILTLVVIIGISVVLYGATLKAETRLVLELLRFMFPYMLLVCVAAVLIGMANARGHFFVPALGAVVLNLIMIASVLFLAPLMGETLDQKVRGLAIGVLFAGLAQALFQLPALNKDGYRYAWVSPWRDPTVREVVKKMIPGSIGVAAFQINVLVTQSFSYWVEPTIVPSFNYAVRLMELPQGLFGVSLATYLLPTLSGMAAEKKYPEFRQTLNQGLGYLAFANLLAAAVSLALAEPIVRLLFERGEFGPMATARVAATLAFLAPGLLFFSMNNILARAFYALNDIQTPMRISVLCLVINLVFAFWLVHALAEAGLALANTLSACLNMALLSYALRKKIGRLEWGALNRSLLVLVPAAVAATVIAWLCARYLRGQFGTTDLIAKTATVFIPMSIAGGLYWMAAAWGKVPAAKDSVHLVLGKLGGRR